ncbi:hypothetical protein RhiirA1_448642 [Rhizophagus irregularis]|uniref:Uncharacterized protein n=1 Tax=Rhizophagus irregularis TaxID=588596 RepID=A0A2I1FE75_9GLOM|nr:hypothetical protein RhiirA1_448642 [Rhizophagus irregularis]PKY32690.1 hypothetical protein RhiirB3_451060 [Rhizophagus irregularis]
MSILNLGLQNVAIKRNTMNEESEALFDKVDTFDEICEILKDQPFKCYNAASEQDINGLFEIKNCQDPSCGICTPIRLLQIIFDSLHFLPDPIPAKDSSDHYSSFHIIYGMETSEEFHPTLHTQINQANAKPALKGILIGGKIHDYVTCCDCRKQRYF